MIRFRSLASFVLVLSWFPLHTLAQDKKNELAFTVGGELIPSNSLASPASGVGPAITYSSSYALDLDYGRRIHTFRHTTLWLDVPAAVGPSHRIASSADLLPTNVATFFVTPSLRLELPDSHRVAPWLSFGGGYGLYETSSRLRGGTPNPVIHTNTGVLQFGGGVDIKTPVRLIVPIGLRAEYRDFYALEPPDFALPVTGQSQHNQVFAAGLTARF